MAFGSSRRSSPRSARRRSSGVRTRRRRRQPRAPPLRTHADPAACLRRREVWVRAKRTEASERRERRAQLLQCGQLAERLGQRRQLVVIDVPARRRAGGGTRVVGACACDFMTAAHRRAGPVLPRCCKRAVHDGCGQSARTPSAMRPRRRCAHRRDAWPHGHELHRVDASLNSTSPICTRSTFEGFVRAVEGVVRTQ